MSGERLSRVLDSAYLCFSRYGMRRTTMEDIAGAAGMSRAAIYQYVRSKDDAFRRLAARLFDGALRQARSAPGGSLAQRLNAVLGAKLDLAMTVQRDSPHAAELLDGASTVCADLAHAYAREMYGLVVEAIADAAERGEIVLGARQPTDLAEIAMALARGLDTDPPRAQRLLHDGITLLIAGLSHVEPRRWR